MTLSLARRADRFPDRTAVVDISEERLYAPAETIHDDRVTYGELSTIATRTAERLATLDIGPGDTVCLVSRNRVASLALFFACRRLGATFAPISHLLTPASVERPFDVLEPDLVVSEAAQRDLVRSIPFDRSVTLDELTEADRESVDFDDRRSEGGAGENPLLVLHGETGRPLAGYSAAAVERNCVTGVVAWGVAANDVAPLTGPLSTPAALVRVALSVLYAGGTLLLDRAFDPGDAVTAIVEEDATLLAGRETALRDIAAESGFADATNSLQRVVCEGPIPEDVTAAYRDRELPVAQVYGRLECPTALSQGFEGRSSASTSETDGTAVGRPVPDCQARLVDDEGTVLDGQATGRLQLSGPMVADGYVTAAGTDDENWYASAELQSEDYDEADDRGEFADGWFDTGDRARRDADGRYYLE
ncbi:class I adenylate-forming enzyme family protein [Natrinema salifodinae]|uniref:Acyl-CoA synthetase (AMP-forming)/AMP-acid ligase II n=1 Tax=Natrinema salifodinae TaxID=1202768 RepID=A0A1I0QHI4_9EURY|nr:class I adenylate-forming enzyme family protein [Natrinema salifodinae]SEW26316.1 Acyl-CoA synthetase (AMP-forming)/AMP-acid ligase II [Natrinema salifodinae]